MYFWKYRFYSYLYFVCYLLDLNILFHNNVSNKNSVISFWMYSVCMKTFLLHIDANSYHQSDGNNDSLNPSIGFGCVATRNMGNMSLCTFLGVIE